MQLVPLDCKRYIQHQNSYCHTDTMALIRAAGTVTNVKEAIAWLSYTYLYVRMMQNPLPYGLSWQELAADPRLDARRFVMALLQPTVRSQCLRWLLMAAASRRATCHNLDLPGCI